MKSEARVKAGKKSKRKGGRIERELVKFLKEQGCLSARRTAQCNGKSKYSESDVVADELSKFHIESKGTKFPNISEATLKEWRDQMLRDCKEEHIPVLFHKANNKPWVCAVTEWTKETLFLTGRGLVSTEKTIVPSYATLFTDEDGDSFDYLLVIFNDYSKVYIYDATYVVDRMIHYENNFRNNGCGGRGEVGAHA